MDKRDVGCIYNRKLLRHFYEMLSFATTCLDLEGIMVSSLGVCIGSHGLDCYPVNRRGGQWVLLFYRLNVLDTNQKVPNISQGFIYMHITPLHQPHEFSRLDFSIKLKEPGDTSTSYYYKSCLLLIHSAPKCKPWVAHVICNVLLPKTVNICGSYTAISLIWAVLSVVYLKVLVASNSLWPHGL